YLLNDNIFLTIFNFRLSYIIIYFIIVPNIVSKIIEMIVKIYQRRIIDIKLKIRTKDKTQEK
ncbi:MAG TPA: hypothetical protein PLW95_08165, partial [bacterium]|nr:hypothetical protein [bacterium]